MFGLFPAPKQAARSGGALPSVVICWQLTSPVHVQSHVRTSHGCLPDTVLRGIFGLEFKDCFLLVHSHSTSTHDQGIKTSCASHKGRGVWEKSLCDGTRGHVLSLPFRASDIQAKEPIKGRRSFLKEPEWVPTHSYLDMFFLSCEVQTMSKKTLFAFKSNVIGIIQILDGPPASRRTSASLEIKP